MQVQHILGLLRAGKGEQPLLSLDRLDGPLIRRWGWSLHALVSRATLGPHPRP